MLTRTTIRWTASTRCIVSYEPTWLGRLLGVVERLDSVMRLRVPGGGYAWIFAATNRDVPRRLAERIDREHALAAVRARKQAIERRA